MKMEYKYEDVLNKLSGYFDCLYEYLDSDEREDMNDLEDEIRKIIHSQEEEIVELEAKLKENKKSSLGDYL